MLKRSTTIISAIVFCLSLGLSSCRDDKDDFDKYKDDQAGLTALVEGLTDASNTTVFKIPGSQLANDRELVLASGAKIALENNDALFQRPDGTAQPCSTCNEVVFEIVEARKPSDWLGWGLPANNNNGELIDHTPALRITATCDNQAIELLPNRYIRTYIPHDELAGYQIAYPAGTVWEQGTANTVFNSNWTINSNNYTGYELLVKKMGWATAIRPFAPNGSMNFCVNLPLQYNLDNTRLYALYGSTQQNIVELEANAAEDGIFCWPNAPTNMAIRIVAISKSGPQYWLAQRTSAAASDNNNLKISPTASDESNIMTFLKGL